MEHLKENIKKKSSEILYPISKAVLSLIPVSEMEFRSYQNPLKKNRGLWFVDMDYTIGQQVIDEDKKQSYFQFPPNIDKVVSLIGKSNISIVFNTSRTPMEIKASVDPFILSQLHQTHGVLITEKGSRLLRIVQQEQNILFEKLDGYSIVLEDTLIQPIYQVLSSIDSDFSVMYAPSDPNLKTKVLLTQGGIIKNDKGTNYIYDTPIDSDEYEIVSYSTEKFDDAKKIILERITRDAPYMLRIFANLDHLNTILSKVSNSTAGTKIEIDRDNLRCMRDTDKGLGIYLFMANLTNTSNVQQTMYEKLYNLFTKRTISIAGDSNSSDEESFLYGVYNHGNLYQVGNNKKFTNWLDSRKIQRERVQNPQELIEQILKDIAEDIKTQIRVKKVSEALMRISQFPKNYNMLK